eukprot:2734434-Prymnesium_polylepis.1
MSALEVGPPPLEAAAAAIPAPARPHPRRERRPERRCARRARRPRHVRPAVRRLPCHQDRRPPACSGRRLPPPPRVRVLCAGLAGRQCRCPAAVAPATGVIHTVFCAHLCDCLITILRRTWRAKLNLDTYLDGDTYRPSALSKFGGIMAARCADLSAESAVFHEACGSDVRTWLRELKERQFKRALAFEWQSSPRLGYFTNLYGAGHMLPITYQLHRLCMQVE